MTLATKDFLVLKQWKSGARESAIHRVSLKHQFETALVRLVEKSYRNQVVIMLKQVYNFKGVLNFINWTTVILAVS